MSGEPCRYIFPEGHERAGERCKSYYIMTGTGGYCKSHAEKLGILVLNYSVKPGDKISAGMDDKQKVKDEVLKTIEERGLMPGKLDPDSKERDLTEKLYHELVNDKGVDISKMVGEISKSGGVNFNTVSPEVDFYIQSLFVMWWMADPGTREPKSLVKLAEVLRRNMFTVRSWLDEEWFYKKLGEGRMNRMKLLSPFIDKKTVLRALGGDRTAMGLFYKQIGPIKSEKVEDDDFVSKLSDDLLKEAIEGTGLDEHSLHLSKDEKELHERFLRKAKDIDMERGDD